VKGGESEIDSLLEKYNNKSNIAKFEYYTMESKNNV
jgi:hypothetical protein